MGGGWWVQLQAALDEFGIKPGEGNRDVAIFDDRINQESEAGGVALELNSFGTQGSVEFMFEHKCNCKISADGIDIEELEFALIDFGIEDVFADTEEKDGETLNIIMVYGQFSEFGNISRGLEELEHEILESGFEYIPTITKEISEEQVAEVEKLIEKLEEDDDVQNVYTTMR